MADRSATHRCFRAPGSQRAPAALPRRVTAADIMCSVVPAGAELRHVELFGNSTAGAPAGSPLAPPLRTKPAHAARTQPSARHHPRAGTSRRVGALVWLNADLRSDSAARLGAAHGSNRCRPTTRLLPLPLSAMRPLRQCTPRTRRQIPLRLATVAAMRPPPALIVTTRLLRYTFLPCAGERTAAAIDGGAAGRVRE